MKCLQMLETLLSNGGRGGSPQGVGRCRVGGGGRDSPVHCLCTGGEEGTALVTDGHSPTHSYTVE